MWEQIQLWDFSALKTINQTWSHPILDWIMAIISSQKLFTPIIIAGILLFLWKGSARGRFFVLLAALNLMVGESFISPCIRSQVQRPRPHETIVGIRRVEWKKGAPQIKVTTQPKEKPGNRSLPSNHVLNNTAIGAVAIWLFRRWRWAILSWIAVMGYARIYTGSHHLSDVMISVWIALTYSFFVYILVECLWQAGKKYWKRWYERSPSLIHLNTN